MIMEPLPGRLRELAGIEIEEYEPLLKTDLDLRDGTMPLQGTAMPFAPRSSSGTIWADILEPKGARVLAKYGRKFYAGKAAVTMNRVGAGLVVYVGTHLARDYADSLAGWLLRQQRLDPPLAVPDLVDVTSREKAGKKTHFVMNFSGSAQTVQLPGAFAEVLSGKKLSGRVVVPPRDLLILAEE